MFDLIARDGRRLPLRTDEDANYTGASYAPSVDVQVFYYHKDGMNKLRPAAQTTTATAFGGSPSGCAR
jgi:hypothetical protein